MDIPQEISDKIASYIRRPYQAEDIRLMTELFDEGDPRKIMTLATFLKACRQTRIKKDEIDEFTRDVRKAWSIGGGGKHGIIRDYA